MRSPMWGRRTGLKAELWSGPSRLWGHSYPWFLLWQLGCLITTATSRGRNRGCSWTSWVFLWSQLHRSGAAAIVLFLQRILSAVFQVWYRFLKCWYRLLLLWWHQSPEARWVQVIHCLFMTGTTAGGGNEVSWWLEPKFDDKCSRRILRLSSDLVCLYEPSEFLLSVSAHKQADSKHSRY